MPEIRSISLSDKARISVWHITETPLALTSMLRLDEEEKAYLRSMISQKRYLHWLSSRVLLRKMLNTRQFIRMEKRADGRPWLPDFKEHISISHSHDMAAVMVADQDHCGVDIEQINPKVARIAPKFIRKDEAAFIDVHYAVEMQILFWSAKETLFKLYRKGQVDFIKDLQIHPFTFNPEGGRFSASIHKPGETSPVVLNYEMLEDYMLVFGIRHFS